MPSKILEALVNCVEVVAVPTKSPIKLLARTVDAPTIPLLFKFKLSFIANSSILFVEELATKGYLSAIRL